MGDILREIIESVPDYENFKTVEELDKSSRELAEKYPDTVKFFEIGKSTAGNPVNCLKIGNGGKSALLYAFPHPNEPIGSMMLDYLAEKLAENEELRGKFDFTWYIVKAADVDGAKLNEGWFKGPFNMLNYALNFYRPAANQQVEWTFPIKYKTLDFDSPIPETKALMKIIEESKPVFIYSLHNAGFGGVYNYISEDAPILYPILEKAYKDLDIPAALGEPEIAEAVNLARAVYKMPTMEDSYDMLEKNGESDPAKIINCGTSSIGYAKRFSERVFELVCEVPYFYDPKVEDMTKTDHRRRDLRLKSIENTRKSYGEIKEILDSLGNSLTVNSPLRAALVFFVDSFEKYLPSQLNWINNSAEMEEMATVAQLFDNGPVAESYNLLIWGLLRRVLLENYEATGNEILRGKAEEIYDKMVSKNLEIEKEMDYKVIPIKKLVQVQLMSGIYSALYSSKVF